MGEQPLSRGTTYQYNFVTDPDGPNATEITVHAVQPGNPRPPGEYYAASADSDVGKLVKEIVKID